MQIQGNSSPFTAYRSAQTKGVPIGSKTSIAGTTRTGSSYIPLHSLGYVASFQTPAIANMSFSARLCSLDQASKSRSRRRRSPSPQLFRAYPCKHARIAAGLPCWSQSPSLEVKHFDATLLIGSSGKPRVHVVFDLKFRRNITSVDTPIKNELIDLVKDQYSVLQARCVRLELIRSQGFLVHQFKTHHTSVNNIYIVLVQRIGSLEARISSFAKRRVIVEKCRSRHASSLITT